jgi:hypothetical protein
MSTIGRWPVQNSDLEEGVKYPNMIYTNSTMNKIKIFESSQQNSVLIDTNINPATSIQSLINIYRTIYACMHECTRQSLNIET